jgi:alkanesulfonate monooxygenase SsuD/methylene tetrahydromethanopterin reductase-like flavin-dependent oxidoreductase (luciferase family)
MRIFHFSEQPYAQGWAPEHASLRVSLPNRHCDPEVMARLYHERLDEYLLADELGLDIMVNEHHQSATCVVPAAVVPMAILARQTRRARLLTLGYPIANRLDPVRVAEELAMIDVISRGRLNMGLVRGVPYELPVAVHSAVGQMDRFWEAHDLIIRALSTRDGCFDWQGEHFQQRNVNVWPRPWQEPHPPVWITGRDARNVREIAERGYVLATFLTGYSTRTTYDVYRAYCAEHGLAPPAADRFAYLGLLAIAEDRKEAMRRAEQIVQYVRSTPRTREPFNVPAGYFSVKDAARMMKSGGRPGMGADFFNLKVEDYVKTGVMFAGTPDDVVEQLKRFHHNVGGLDNFLMMAHAGPMNHADTEDQLRLLAKEVLPRMQAVHADRTPAPAAPKVGPAGGAEGRAA